MRTGKGPGKGSVNIIEQNVQTPLAARNAVVNSVGFGIVCGLTFPLMISSTFLQELSLSHGAGNSFGALFFIAYGLTMLFTALRSAMGSKAFRPISMPVSFASVFAGNVLMMLVNFSIISPSWIYAIVTSGLIGFGLASTELGWLSHIKNSSDEQAVYASQIIPMAFLCGAALASAIFILPNYFEIGLALLSVLGSAALFSRFSIPRVKREPLSLSSKGIATVIQSVCYLAVFSFVFGAISQVASATKGDLVPISVQAIGGIVIAAVIMLVGTRKTKAAADIFNLYGILFPIVAVALVSLPFITSSAVHIAAATLVFVSYYLTSINVRIILCQLSHVRGVSLWVYLGSALGISAFLILGGVAFGAYGIADNDPFAGLTVISMISLFVLALNPIIANRLERRMGIERDEENAARENGNAATAVQRFGEEHSLTPRELDVLKLICLGRTRSYIADELGLSQNTVKGYIHNVYQKCGAVDKQDLLDRVELFTAKHE